MKYPRHCFRRILQAYLLSFVFLFISTGCRSGEKGSSTSTPISQTTIYAPDAEHPFPLIVTPNFKGAIVLKEDAAGDLYLNRYRGFWTPTTNEVFHVEARLKEYLAGSTNKYAPQIRSKLSWFYRQYVGYTARGEKFILCNFLPGEKGERLGHDHFDSLRKAFIKVYDGGPDYWVIHYNVSKDQCEGLRVDLGY